MLIDGDVRLLLQSLERGLVFDAIVYALTLVVGVAGITATLGLIYERVTKSKLLLYTHCSHVLLASPVAL